MLPTETAEDPELIYVHNERRTETAIAGDDNGGHKWMEIGCLCLRSLMHLLDEITTALTLRSSTVQYHWVPNLTSPNIPAAQAQGGH